QGLGVDPTAIAYGIYEVLLNPEGGADFAVMTTAHGVDLIPSALELAGAELELAGKVGRELLLRKALRQTRERYDYVLIDPPPSLGIFSLNALAVADAVLVPMQLHAYALQAMPQLEQTIEMVREIHPTLNIGGIICTLADRRTNLSVQIEKQVREHYGELVFDTVIPMNIKLAEAPTSGTPIGTYAAQSAGALAYAALASELEARYAQ
ncbi:MAG: ParA family protein, partial [Candidatus Viridilinea halotolerans]